jgi:protein TonB
MEAKKSKNVDLRNKSTLFFEVGMIVAIGVVMAAFQWNTEDKLTAENLQFTLDVDYDEELIPITRPEKEEQKQQPPQHVETLVLVEDDVEFEEVEIESTEADQATVVNMVPLEDEKIEDDSDYIFRIVEDKPVFPGGDAGLMSTISKQIVYPEIARENGIQGRVFVEFVVNQHGEVEQVKVVRGVDPSLDKEALRVIQNLPKWIPGMQRGKPVKVAFTVPINFQLQ